jgi:hypothetical protein
MENKGKTTVILTYNSVRGYDRGVYQGRDGPVAVISNDNRQTWGDQAPEKLAEIIREVVKNRNLDEVGKIYLYIGANAAVESVQLAQVMKAYGKDLELVACTCGAEAKDAIARDIGVPITWADCGGRQTLGEIVDRLVQKEPANA